VSDGALSFYLDRFVRCRVSKVTYGTFCNVKFDPASADHQQRHSASFLDIDGNRYLPRMFSVILPKVRHFMTIFHSVAHIFMEHTQISETKEFKRNYHILEKSKKEFNSVLNVWSYRGVLSEPKWKDVDSGNLYISTWIFK